MKGSGPLGCIVQDSVRGLSIQNLVGQPRQGSPRINSMIPRRARDQTEDFVVQSVPFAPRTLFNGRLETATLLRCVVALRKPG